MIPGPSTRRGRRAAALVRLAVVGLLLGAPASLRAAPGPWTAQDREAAIRAALVTAGSSATDLLALAEGLARGGDRARARDLIRRAGRAAASPTVPFGAGERERAVEALVGLDDVDGARTLADASGSARERIFVRGRIGAALARADDVAGAEEEIAAMAAIAASSPDVAGEVGGVGEALGGIALGFHAAGRSDAALALADRVPDGVPKLRVLAERAALLCRSGRDDDRARGRELASRATGTAAAAPTPFFPQHNPYPAVHRHRMLLTGLAAEAVAACEGTDAAIGFVRGSVRPERFTETLASLATRFYAEGKPDLARAFDPPAPPPDPTDAEGLLAAARLMVARGRTDAARALASRASRVARGAVGDRATLRSNGGRLLNDIAAVLLELGDEEEGLATVRPLEATVRRGHYVGAIEAQARRGDADALARTLPEALEVVMASDRAEPSPDDVFHGSAPEAMARLIRVLTRAGRRDMARAPYARLAAMPRGRPRGRPALAPWDLAELQARMGDLPAACATAERAGPLAPTATAAQVADLARLLAGGGPPTASDLARARASLGRDNVSARALALLSIASALAEEGEVRGALDAVAAAAGGGVGESFADARDEALAAVTAAQLRADDLRGALSVALRISRPSRRWPPLLILVSTPPR